MKRQEEKMIDVCSTYTTINIFFLFDHALWTDILYVQVQCIQYVYEGGVLI